LARVAFGVTKPALEAQVERLARSMLATAEEQEAAVEAAWSALRHPLMVAAASAEEVRREAAVTHLRDDGVLVEGVVDLAFRVGAQWHVIEFKTDDTLERHREQYVAQTQAYVAAIAAATGMQVSGTLLLV
jgi:ATP-dependent exoDNAse (exonuclease V) beta subunit